MKNIKYKAWERNTKSMILDYVHQGSNGELFTVIFHERAEPSPNLVLMQFTGSYDKNGNEIYEGDIVCYTDNPTNISGGVSEVLFEPGFIGIRTDMNISLCDIESYWVEIIGNKYENPELLEAEP